MECSKPEYYWSQNSPRMNHCWTIVPVSDPPKYGYLVREILVVQKNILSLYLVSLIILNHHQTPLHLHTWKEKQIHLQFMILRRKPMIGYHCRRWWTQFIHSHRQSVHSLLTPFPPIDPPCTTLPQFIHIILNQWIMVTSFHQFIIILFKPLSPICLSRCHLDFQLKTFVETR